MKKFFSILLVMTLFLCALPTASAAGSASLNGPSVVRAGDTITLTFYAGGGILGGKGSVSFDPTVLTLKEYKQLVGGSWALEWNGNNFLFYDNSVSSPITGTSAIFQAIFTVNAKAAVGTQIRVSATGVTLSNEQKQDVPIGTVSYSTSVAEPLSNNCNLSNLTVTGAEISPAFTPANTYYTANVPFGVHAITVNGQAEHAGAKVNIYNPTLVAGATTTVQVTVTAENGTKKVYNIAVTREQDPNYVPSNNADLKSLTATGYALSPAFRADVTQYYIWLPYEVEKISLSAAAADAKASCAVGDGSQLTAGARTDIPVTVTAEDGTQKVYTVTVVRAPSHDQVEDYLAGPKQETPPEVTEPVTPPPTQPTPTEPVPSEPAPELKTAHLILTGGLSFAAGAGILALILFLLRKKKEIQ